MKKKSNKSLVIVGFGLAGCLLTRKLLLEGLSSCITIIDPTFTTTQKHLCFYTDDEGLTDGFVAREYTSIAMRKAGGNKISKRIQGDSYKLLDWKALHASTLNMCVASNQVTLVRGECLACNERDNGAEVKLKTGEIISALHAFNATGLGRISSDCYQQFQGAIVQTKRDVFDPAEAMLMDFNIHSKSNEQVTFKYVLPYTKNRALVEFTVIGPSILPWNVISDQLNNMLNTDYEIDSIDNYERGIIPMSSILPLDENTEYITYIGLSGNKQRRSTGYLLQFLLDDLKTISLDQPSQITVKNQHHFRQTLDSIFIKALLHNPSKAGTWFTKMLKASTADTFLEFMFKPLTLSRFLPILKALPKLPFIKHAANHFTNLNSAR